MARSLGFEAGDILLVRWKGLQRPVEVKKILPNFDITYGDLLNPEEWEDKHIHFCSLDGFEILHRPKLPCYEACLKLPAERLRLAVLGQLGYAEVLRFNEPPEGHSRYVVHIHGDTGRCWECSDEIDALTIFNEVMQGRFRPEASSDEWFCSGMK